MQSVSDTLDAAIKLERAADRIRPIHELRKEIDGIVSDSSITFSKSNSIKSIQ